MSRTQAEKDAALLRVLYDLSVLANAVTFLRQWKRKPKGEDLAEEQLVLNAALVKERLLYDFFSATAKKDDIIASQLVPTKPVICGPEEKIFREEINKWCAHITWDRVDHIQTDAPPKRKAAIRFGRHLLRHGIQFVEDCLTSGFRLTSTGKVYWRRITQAKP